VSIRLENSLRVLKFEEEYKFFNSLVVWGVFLGVALGFALRASYFLAGTLLLEPLHNPYLV
jgi:hypothetical protein